METEQATESKIACTLYGEMWQKPDGFLIGPHEKDQFLGPTTCFHEFMQL